MKYNKLLKQYNEKDEIIKRFSEEVPRMINESKEFFFRALENKHKNDIKVMRETVIKSKQDQYKLQVANTKIQFEMAEQKRLASESERSLAQVREELAKIKEGEEVSELNHQRKKKEAKLETENKHQTFENLVKQLEDASSQVEVMRETVIKSKQEQDKLQVANTKIQFEMAEQKRLASELTVAKSKLEHERRKMASIQEESERSLAQVREELAKVKEDVSDLKELLQEAGNEFIVKEEELQAAEKELKEREGQVNEQGLVIQDLQTQLEESHLVLEEVNNQLEDKEKRIEELEQASEQAENANNEKLEKRIVIVCLREELTLVKMKCQSNEE